MDGTHILMVIVGLVSFILAFLGVSNWIAVGLPSLSPVGLMVGKMLFNNVNIKDIGEALLFVSPFVVAMVCLCAMPCYLAATLGRVAGRRFRPTRSSRW